MSLHRLVALVGLGMLLAGTAACGNTTPGRPSAVGTDLPEGAGALEATTGTNSWPVNQPCSLLSSDELTQLGASAPPSQEMVGTAHSCELNTSGYNVVMSIRTNDGLAGFHSLGGKVVDTTVGSHQAKQELDSPTCVVAIGVSDLSRVDVTVTSLADADPCSGADSVAKLVEPRLP